MAYQKGLNANRNHHDSLSQSGNGNTRYDNHQNSGNNYNNGPVHSGNDRPYGQGKHSNGGKPKQYHY